MQLLTPQNRKALYPSGSEPSTFVDDLVSALGAAIAQPRLKTYLRESDAHLVIYSAPAPLGGTRELQLDDERLVVVEKGPSGESSRFEPYRHGDQAILRYFPKLDLPTFIDGLNRALSDRLGRK